MESLFDTKSVAVIGASRNPKKVGCVVFKNVLKNFGGKVYPINPSTKKIDGVNCHSSVGDVRGNIDLAIIVIPAKFVPDTLEQCGKKGVKNIVIISAGFKETGLEGLKLEKQSIEIAEKYGMRILGPNCIGFIDTYNNLNATFATEMPLKGNISFMSQSGALCTSILDWAKKEGVGFSKFVSLGNKADLNENDFIRFFNDDEKTSVILAYLEGLEDGTEFIKTAKKVSKRKPIIMLKSGRTASGAKAAASHTGALAGSDSAYSAALKQSGVIRADTTQELFDYAIGFSNQPVPKGKRVAILTNAGGPGIITTDACESSGLELASLGKETLKKLKKNLPAAANIYNPVDVLGDAPPERYGFALEVILKDSNVDAVLVLLTPQATTEPSKTARIVSGIAKKTKKTVLCSFMGGHLIDEARSILKKNGIPNYLFPERAVSSLHGMVTQAEIAKRTYNDAERFKVDRGRVRKLIDGFLEREQVNVGLESLEILKSYGIPVTDYFIGKNIEEVTKFAENVGYPVALKIVSPEILHKTDFGGVKLNVTGENIKLAYNQLIFSAKEFRPDVKIDGVLVQKMVTDGKEVIIGLNRDPQLGPLLMFGLGGIYVEVLKDVTFRVAPVVREEVRQMIAETKGYIMLRGTRGEKQSDIKSIEDSLLRLSLLVNDFPEIVELDINPVKVFENGRGCVAIDARIVLKKAEN